MSSPANLPQPCQFLEDMATTYSFIGNRRTVFLISFDKANKDIERSEVLKLIEIKWINSPEHKGSKLSYELDEIRKVLNKHGCLVNKGKRGQQPQGGSPTEQVFKWLWETKFPEWQQKQTIKVPSEQAQKTAISLFLKNIEDKSNKLYLLHHREKPIVLKDQYIPIQVTLERRYNHLVETIWSYSESETEFKRVYALKGLEDKPTQVDWAEAKQQHRSIMVLADPGMGKSTLLKMEAGLIAQAELNSLANNLTNIEDVTLPLLIKLSELAEATKELETEVIKAIPKLIEARCKNFEEIKLVLEDKLQKGQCILLLDALDEVPNEQRKRLSEKLNYFLDHHPCPIICTSRLVGYGAGFVEGAKDMEIVPFSQKQTEQYIETWFRNAAGYLSDETVSASELIQELRNKPQVGGLAQNPLLLSLICSLYQEKGLTLPARRCQVYKKAVDYMLGKWSKNRNPELDEAWVDAKAELLEELAYQFSCEGRDVFTLRELRHKIDKYLRSENASSDFRDKKASQLVTELSEQDGILQKLSREGDKYLFLHRTFQEYFTACYLKRNRDCVALAKGHFWEYDWHETLSLLAGLMDKPILLIQAITDEKDDIFSTLLLLAGRCMAECCKISNLLVDNIIDKIFKFWCRYPSARFIQSVLVEIGRVNSQMFQMLLIKADNNSEWSLKYAALGALGEIGNPQALETLRSVFNDSDVFVRKRAAEAWERIGKPTGEENLITDINASYELEIMRSAAISGKLINHRGIEALIIALDLKDWNELARWREAGAFSKIGNPPRVKALITAVKSLHESAGWETAVASGKMGSSETLAKLIQLPEIDIYNPDIFLLARTLAIRFSRDKLPFIPVYPELVAHKLY